MSGGLRHSLKAEEGVASSLPSAPGLLMPLPSLDPSREHVALGDGGQHATPSTSSLAATLFDSSKAGLQTVDKQRVEAIIHEASKGSSYYLNEQRKMAAWQRRVEKLIESREAFNARVARSPDYLKEVQKKVDGLVEKLEAGRRLDRIVVHMDMDMFYAAVEEKKDPRLKDLPFGVGSSSMLSTTNYIARQYGVRSGMPGFIGKKLCPTLVIVPTDFGAYKQEAQRVRDIAAQYDASFRSVGLDELTMDFTDYLASHYPSAVSMEEKYTAAEEAVQMCRSRVLEATQLTASAGIGPTSTLSKIASNYQKPNGQHTLQLFKREDVVRFVQQLRVRQIPGIGKSQEAILAGIGITTMKDIYENRYIIYSIMTPKTAVFLLAASLGLGGFFDGDLVVDSEGTGDSGQDDGLYSGRKSIGQERTFYRLQNIEELHELAYVCLHDAYRRLASEGLLCGQVVLKIKYTSFQVRQFSHSLSAYSADEEMLRCALNTLLLPLHDSFMELRLLGVRLGKLASSEAKEQKSTWCADLPRRQLTLNCFVKAKRQKREDDDFDGGCEPEVRVVSQPTNSGREMDASGQNEVVILSSGSSVEEVLEG